IGPSVRDRSVRGPISHRADLVLLAGSEPVWRRDGLTGAGPRGVLVFYRTGVRQHVRRGATDPVTTGRHHRWRVMTAVTVSPETTSAVPEDAEPEAGPAVPSAAGGASSRHARALAALRSAEARTGVRGAPTPRAGSSSAQVRALPGGLAAPGRRQSARGGAGDRTGDRGDGAVPAGRVVPGPEQGARVLPVHPYLAPLLPDGGLRAGSTVVVRGSTSLLLALLAEASRDGAWTVLVGYPAAGIAAAADAGCDLERTLVVPLPAGSAVDAPAVLAALVDGMDVVVIGPEVTLLDHDRRRLAARARDRGTGLVPAVSPLSAGNSPSRTVSTGRTSRTRREDGVWSGAHVVLDAVDGGWAGIDHGAGWLRRRTLRVRRTGRGSAARPLDLDVEVPVCRVPDLVADLAEPLAPA